MKILLFEWLTGGGLLLDGQPLAASTSLFREGAAMATALTEDWTAAGHEVTVLLDHRCPESVPAHQFIRVSAPHTWEPALTGLAAIADRIMVIAPETGQRLERTLALLEPYRGRLLCPSGEAVVVGSSKHRTALRLEAAGVQRPFGRLLLPDEQPHRSAEFASLANGKCLVIKPDDGSGSEGVRLVNNDLIKSEPEALADTVEPEALADSLEPEALADNADPTINLNSRESASASGSQEFAVLSAQAGGEGGGGYRIERFLHGLPVSICLVAGPAGVWFLPPTRQRFKTDLEPIREPPGSDAKLRSLRSDLGSDPLSSRFPDRLLAAFDSSTADHDWPGAWSGFDWPLVPGLAERALVLARRAIAALPAFTGPAGLDMILSASDPAEDRVVDFNPRLTSSWVGLRQLFHANLGAYLLSVIDGAPPPELTPVGELLEWRL